MRKKLIAGNWKMNKTPSEAMELVELLKNKVKDSENDVVFCVPFIDLDIVCDILKETDIHVGAQNMYFEDKGAYTGEISADMIKNVGADYVIIGHSERRAYFAETDETVNLKVKKAIEKELNPIVCVGESLEQKETKIGLDFVRLQVKCAFKDISPEDALKVTIAYEPIWAIGTGRTASNEDAQAFCKAIRDTIAEIYDSSTAENIRILYGGSVKSTNAKGLFAMPDIDGALVGGASLNEDFEKIVNYNK